jgi:YfiH family protein
MLQAASLSVAGVKHGFTTRLGGVSQGDFSSNNLSSLVDDDPAAVEENRRRFERETGLRWEDLAGLSQVHEDGVLVVDRPVAELPPVEQRCFDASVSDRPEAVLAVRTADCVPLLLFCPERRVAAAVHAGWRGSLSGIAARAVESMTAAYACLPADLLAAIGPCIHVDAFEVGAEVFEPFHSRFGAPVAQRRSAALHVDLVAANQQVLLEAGLSADRIEVIDHCTCARDDLFYSHRRDKGRTGRQMAFICVAP